MKRNKLMFSILFLVFSTTIILTACWSPWLNSSASKSLAIKQFIEMNNSVQDGCGINCENCGAKDVKWIPFGKKLTIEYNCGGPLDPAALPKNNQTTATISFIGTVRIDGFEE